MQRVLELLMIAVKGEGGGSEELGGSGGGARGEGLEKSKLFPCVVGLMCKM